MAFTVRDTAQGAQFALRVQPRASRNAIVGTIAGGVPGGAPGGFPGGFHGTQGEAVKLAITAPPVDGKANQAVIDFFSDLFGVAKSSIVIVAGETGRNKLIAVRGLSAQQVHKALGL